MERLARIALVTALFLGLQTPAFGVMEEVPASLPEPPLETPETFKPFSYYHYGVTGVFMVLPFPELGLGVRKRFTQSFGADFAFGAHSVVSINHAGLRGCGLYYLGDDPGAGLGDSYFGLGLSVDVLFGEDVKGLFHSSPQYAGAAHLLYGREYLADNGSKRFLQLGVAFPLPMVTICWGRQH